MTCARGDYVPEEALLVERNTAESFEAERVVPGAEVHADQDITWVVHPGDFWRNASAMVRLSAPTAGKRLDAIVRRYQTHGRGMGLWVSPAATPRNLAELLTARRFRCRKYYPAMLRNLTRRIAAPSRPSGLEIRRVRDWAEFEKTGYPSIGPLTTPLRRQAFGRLRALTMDRSERTLALVAYLDNKPVAASELFIGSESSGLLGLTVLPQHRGQGIGAALLEETCKEAVRCGASTMALIATNDGERLYARRGFSEVARFGYWYRSFQRPSMVRKGR